MLCILPLFIFLCISLLHPPPVWHLRLLLCFPRVHLGLPKAVAAMRVSALKPRSTSITERERERSRSRDLKELVWMFFTQFSDLTKLEKQLP